MIERSKLESGENISAGASPSYEMDFNNVRFIGYVVNALALAGDEGRGKLR